MFRHENVFMIFEKGQQLHKAYIYHDVEMLFNTETDHRDNFSISSSFNLCKDRLLYNSFKINCKVQMNKMVWLQGKKTNTKLEALL